MHQPSEPAWRFAPTGGGAEQGNNPGQTLFANDAVRQMVRETLQNSLDHHEGGLEDVRVKYRLFKLNAEDFGTNSLIDHITESLEEAARHRDQATIDHYHKMPHAILQSQVTCLAIEDSNTTGLKGENWENLILREGVPSITPGTAHGGSFGYGKNAVFNISQIHTVIYSTRYVERAAKGRVTKMIGRSQLRTHNDPHDPSQRLQPVGFYAFHQEEPNQPLMGPQIPKAFCLQDSGTGIFILAFDQATHRDWQDQIKLAAASQFFPAIHWGNLSVSIQDDILGTTEVIDQTSLDTFLDDRGDRNRTYHYYKALLVKPQETVPTGRLSQMGPIQVWVSTNKTAPRRLAHINRRGMLITDSNERKDNPLRPYGGGQWTPWAAVTMASEEPTDRFIRQMEPPTHNAVRPAQLKDRDQRDHAEAELKHHNEKVKDLIRAQIAQDYLDQADNVTELAELFPGAPWHSEGVNLKVTERHFKNSEAQLLTIEADNEADDADANYWQEGDADQQTPSSNNTPNSGPRQQNPSDTLLRQTRIIRTSPNTLAMTFITPTNSAKQMRFGLRAAGEQYQRSEEHIPLQRVLHQGDITVQATVIDGDLLVTAPPNTQVNLKLQEADSKYNSYRLATKAT